jgi:4-diphosphocytidyl-2-C-methyl-D-erythritol kinase
LGGGSSDAAAALRVANHAWELDWPIERLAEVATEIGSDVPFFLNGGAAICRGRGERVERFHGLRRLHFVVAKPASGFSTSDVYRAYESSANPDSLRSIAGWRNSGRLEIGRWMFNRLQAAAASLSPWVDRLWAAFDKLDFLGHQLSGSGSAYFGVCRHAQHARRLATILRRQQLGLVYATRSCA